MKARKATDRISGQNRVTRGSLFTLLELLLVLAIIVFLSRLLLKAYFGRQGLDKKTQESLSAEGIDTGSYKTILDSAKKKAQESNQKLIERQNIIEGLK